MKKIIIINIIGLALLLIAFIYSRPEKEKRYDMYYEYDVYYNNIAGRADTIAVDTICKIRL